ncbi:3-carboxy-cis,cis-muconate cycloisomerase [Nitratireductor sp. GISD-1A_MAKvit]|uniref:3-carboxy-cis,cis-muconate cycloisomerase n=1 Tax=Nitratireductor sp. GISD-1A_MAKvit TaxID=3234198 RepID=UPI003466DEBC
MTISAFDHPILSGLLGDEELAALFSAQAEIEAMLHFEAELALAGADENVIPREAAREIATSLDTFSPEIRALKAGINQDGVVIPSLVSQIRATLSETTRPHLHFGATSQDVIDTGFALRAREAIEILERRLDGLLQSLEALEERDGQIDVMAHTRMQAAIPVPAARKIRSWSGPLMRHTKKLAAVRDEIAVLHFGGAAGTLDRLGHKGEAVAGRLAARLELALPEHPRHSERDGIVALASVLSLISGSLGKMGQDIALAAQSEIGEVELATGGGSSAMPHKKNPVAAEALVTLARFNGALVSGMHQALVHENERSGAAWTLEWMLLPQMIVATGAALLKAADLVDGLTFRARSV